MPNDAAHIKRKKKITTKKTVDCIFHTTNCCEKAV